MKASVCTRYGPPDVLRIKEVEKPEAGDNEVLVKVYAATVNRTDCGILRASPFISRLFTGLFRPRNQITGTEFAGEVEAVGNNVSSFKTGDKVFGFKDFDPGTHAQYLTVSENRALATIPENITYEQAAASTEGAHYAYNFINKVNLRSGQRVLVNGSTGAIGSAAVQLLKYFGADITAVCNTRNIDLVKSLGAGKVIDYEKEDFTKSDQKYDFIFDTVGNSSFSRCKALLEDGGVYMPSEPGFMAQNIFLALLRPIIRNKKVIFPFPVNTRGSVLLIKKLIEEGKFKAVIDRQYPLEQIVEAFKYVEKGQKTGNVVITISHDSGD